MRSKKSGNGARATPNAFSRTRRDHRTEVAEDYVELIDELIRERGRARAIDIARRLGVSHVTVSKTVIRLIEAGLVTSEPYRSIKLTDDGRKMAQASRERHEIVHSFLLALGVDSTTAENDAEGMEHHVSEATLRAMRDFAQR